MGIGNTTAASALTARLCGAPPDEVIGRGTGVDDAGLGRKARGGRARPRASTAPPADALDVLAELGGFEIAGLAGVVLGAAAARVPVVVDGFIAGAAALAATRIAPAAGGYLIASHRSVEAGHRRVLEALGTAPLLDLEPAARRRHRRRAGDAAHRRRPQILAEMATFASAGVSTRSS